MFIVQFKRTFINFSLIANDNDNSIVNKDITLIEVEKAIESLDVGKAPGMDGICNHILKEAKFVIIPILCVLFKCLSR